MANEPSNEFLRSKRAQNDEKDLFSAIGKQVLGLERESDETTTEDDRVKIVEEIESLCMNCHEDGNTRLLLTKIPFFREVILSSFYCEHCSFRNNEIQPAGQVQEQGVKYTLKVMGNEDLQRQIVKSDAAIVRIEDLDIEIPSGKGRLTNVEGIVSEVLIGLKAGQEERKKVDAELFEKIDVIVHELEKLESGEKLPFVITLDDPTGNSSIEPLPADAQTMDKYTSKHYPRTPAQNAAIGLGEETEAAEDPVDNVEEADGPGLEDVEIMEGQTYELQVQCPGCTSPAQYLVQMVNIPHFKQVVLSSTKCSVCNYSSSDVKTGGEVPEKGKRIYLTVKTVEDLGRDILKSESCTLKLPEFEIEVVPGTMGGRFTSVEGILTQIRDDLKKSIFGDDDDTESDSMAANSKARWVKLFSNLDKAIKSETEYTIILEDPLAGSYCQELGEPGEDTRIRSEEYERTTEEEDHLGLNDMKTHLNEDGEYVKESVVNLGKGVNDVSLDAKE